MKKSNFILCLLFLCSSLWTLSAQEVKPNSVKTPGKNKVVLVGRIVLKNPIDHEARIPADKKNDKAFQKEDTFDIRFDDSFYGRTSATYNIGQPFFYTMSVDSKSKKVSLLGFDAYLFANSLYDFFLPILATATIPADTKYVYIGTFEYDLDYALRITSLKIYDEYDDACEWLKTATGNENAELIRVELEAMKE